MKTESAMVVMTTTASGKGEKLARALVEEGLAACVSRVPVTSTFRWQGQIEDEQEELLLIKTGGELWEALQARVRELHDYDVPELVALEAAAVERSYLAWLLGSLVEAV